MATISVTIPDAVLTRVVDGICYQNRYQDTVIDPEDPTGPPIPNPETKNQFAKRMVIMYVKDCVRAWEANQSAESARETAIQNVNTEINLS